MAVLVLVALVLAIVALRRSGGDTSLLARIAELERQVRQLRELLTAAEPRADSARPTAQTEEAESPVGATASPESSAPPPATVVPRSVGEPPPPEADRSPSGTGPAPGRVAPPRPPSPPPHVRIDWERLLGVRGAAILGGVALALAGLLFFKYSIEHGLIPPWLRVVMGTLVGLACVAGSEWGLRRSYAGTADALAGAGVVILYAAFWAAGVLYELVGLGVAFAGMLAVTAACCALSWRHASQVIAVLGLVGGFATPLLLSNGSDHPIGLFGYILLLDVGLLALARQRGWPALGLLSLTGTVLYEGFWIGTRMGPDRVFLGLAVLGVFAVLFAVAGRTMRKDGAEVTRQIDAAGVLVPFAFALYFAGSAHLGVHLYPLAMLLLLLCGAAAWIGRAERDYRMALNAAAATVGVIFVFLLKHVPTSSLAWEAAVTSLVLATTFHVFVEWDPGRSDRDGPAPAAVVASLGLMVVLVLESARAGAAPWPWVVGSMGLAALVIRHAGFAGREVLHLAAALAVGLALAVPQRAHGMEASFPALAVYLAVLLTTSVAFQAVAFVRAPAARPFAEHAAAVLPVVLLLHLASVPLRSLPPPWLFLGGTSALGLLTALAATRLGFGPWLLIAVVATALVHSSWGLVRVGGAETTFALGGLGMQLGAVVVFTAWPFLTAVRFRSDRWAWRAAALAAPLWFPALRQLFILRFADGAIGILPLALGALSLAAATRVRDLWPRGAPLRTSSLAWFSATALGFAAIAVPLQLEKEWITVGWALEGLAVTVLWTRLDHPGLKYFALALLAAVTVRLVANEAVLGYYPRPAWRIVNWLLYTYLVPATALLWTSTILRTHEVGRARDWERTSAYQWGQPIGAFGCGLAGLLVIFVWINLAIADWFAAGPSLQISFARLPARDLTTSIAWALYALGLLAAGVARESIGLRWASLSLVMVTVAKVFLYDLGELHDLYRVASLLGLAVSLIVISLAYQRFVFRGVRPEST